MLKLGSTLRICGQNFDFFLFSSSGLMDIGFLLIFEHNFSVREVYFLADSTTGQAYGTVCRLSVCRLSVCLSSVTFCIVAKRYVLAKKCLKE